MGEPWYTGGLRFGCTRSGRCCTGAPGAVRLSDDELAAVAAAVGLTPERFRRDHARTLPDGTTSLRERASGDCVLYRPGEGCLAYAARPRQCRTWPFWRANLASPEAWAAAGRRCPGIGRGPLHDAAAIRETAADDGTAGGRLA